MPKGKQFVFHTAVVNTKEFQPFVDLAARLKPFGDVALNVGHVVGRSEADIPEGGSPWHDYTSTLPVLTTKLFPHPKEQPFVDMNYVKKNRALLKQCVNALRKQDLAACIWTHEPFFLAEAFFEKYPHLRGPRLDHPRRTRREQFGICRDHPEGKEMLAWCVAEMKKEVPELNTLAWLTNDAGGGICWAEYLYPGSNGPDHCRHLNAGQHVANILEGFDKGAGDTPMDIMIDGNFTANEVQLMPHYIDQKRVFMPRGENRIVKIGSSSDNPVRGMFNPVGIIASLERSLRPEVRKVTVGLRTNYSRYHELPETAEKIVEIMTAFYSKPARGTIKRLQLLRNLCIQWVGKKQADDLLETLIDLDEAFRYKNTALPRFKGNYAGVSTRHITRPLVAMPDRLTPEEEAYFLPHVFNPSFSEGRMDYIEVHGGRLFGSMIRQQYADPRPTEVGAACSRFNRVARSLEQLEGDGDAAVFRGLGQSLRMYASVIRSIGNFYAMQIVRDRNAEQLAGEPQVHAKIPSSTGHPDLLLIHEYMRDELDNTTSLLAMLEDGGLDRTVIARRPTDVEDCFMLGADLPDQLRQKMQIMRRHWLDASQYLAPPHR